jgi:hypothetical protein
VNRDLRSDERSLPPFRADEIAGATYVVRYRLKRWAPETGFVANGSRGHLQLEAEWGVIP